MDLIFIGLGCWFLYFVGYLIFSAIKDEYNAQKRGVAHRKRVEEINAAAREKKRRELNVDPDEL